MACERRDARRGVAPSVEGLAISKDQSGKGIPVRAYSQAIKAEGLLLKQLP